MTPIPLSKYRALDEQEKNMLVAKHVMALEVKRHEFKTPSGHTIAWYCYGDDNPVPRYHSDLNACHEMIKHLENDGKHQEKFMLHAMGRQLISQAGLQTLEEVQAWYAAFTCLTATASELIEAALLAVGAVVEDEG